MWHSESLLCPAPLINSLACETIAKSSGTSVAANPDWLPTTPTCAQAPLVNAVTFAPPQVGGPAFMDRFSQLVNSRGVTFTDDIVQQARRWGGGMLRFAGVRVCRMVGAAGGGAADWLVRQPLGAACGWMMAQHGRQGSGHSGLCYGNAKLPPGCSHSTRPFLPALQFPCDPEMPACPAKPSGILGSVSLRGRPVRNMCKRIEWRLRSVVFWNGQPLSN